MTTVTCLLLLLLGFKSSPSSPPLYHVLLLFLCDDIGNMLHGVLAKHNMWAFSKANIAHHLAEARYVQVKWWWW